MLTEHQSIRCRPFAFLSQRNARRGVMLMELVAGAVLLIVAVSLVVQVIAGQAAAERAMQRKLVANEILSNVMEEQAVLPFEEVTEQSVAKLTLSAEALQLLPGALLKGSLVADEGAVPGKKLSLELTWPDAGGQTGKPVVLTAWLYPPVAEETAP